MASIEIICSNCAGTIRATEDCLAGHCPNCKAAWDVTDYWETESELAQDEQEGIDRSDE